MHSAMRKSRQLSVKKVRFSDDIDVCGGANGSIAVAIADDACGGTNGSVAVAIADDACGGTNGSAAVAIVDDAFMEWYNRYRDMSIAVPKPYVMTITETMRRHEFGRFIAKRHGWIRVSDASGHKITIKEIVGSRVRLQLLRYQTAVIEFEQYRFKIDNLAKPYKGKTLHFQLKTVKLVGANGAIISDSSCDNVIFNDFVDHYDMEMKMTACTKDFGFQICVEFA